MPSSPQRAAARRETRKLGITELLSRIGDDNVKLQNLGESMTHINQRKGGVTEIAFLTDAITPTEAIVGEAKYLGFVLWLPTAAVKAVMAAHNAEVPDAR